MKHHPEWKSSDGLHPNDAGYAMIVRRMDAALAKLALEPCTMAKVTRPSVTTATTIRATTIHEGVLLGGRIGAR